MSDDFPKQFTVETDAFGQGAFGSVHLVIDTCRPEERKFVAKRIYLKRIEDMVRLE